MLEGLFGLGMSTSWKPKEQRWSHNTNTRQNQEKGGSWYKQWLCGHSSCGTVPTINQFLSLFFHLPLHLEPLYCCVLHPDFIIITLRVIMTTYRLLFSSIIMLLLVDIRMTCTTSSTPLSSHLLSGWVHFFLVLNVQMTWAASPVLCQTKNFIICFVICYFVSVNSTKNRYEREEMLDLN